MKSIRANRKLKIKEPYRTASNWLKGYISELTKSYSSSPEWDNAAAADNKNINKKINTTFFFMKIVKK